MLIALLTVLALLKNTLSRRGNCICDEIHTKAAVAPPSQTPTPTKSLATTTTATNSKNKTEKFELFESRIWSKMSHLHDSMRAADGGDNVDGDVTGAPDVIVFKTGDKQCCHEINGRHVQVVGSSGSHDHGSSNVKLKNIVDYKWEIKNYPGHLIAVHIDGNHVAYVINVNNKVSRIEGMVRVVNPYSGQRALIKGMAGEVLDLQFAHIEKDRILASIDMNSLYVHKIDAGDGVLLCNLIIKVEDPLANYTPKYDKISWCPYVDGPIEEDDSQLIVWSRGSMFQCFNVNHIVAEHGIGKIHPAAITTGYLKFNDDNLTITWVQLSPDGSTLGVGNTEGVIRFYQVYMHDKEPRCLHQWKPHNGRPISSFFFLDDLTKKGSDAYWKYAITGAANNTEFKVWDCGTWECLQTLTLSTTEEQKSPARFIVEIDRTSSYLVVTSLERRTCYVLQIINTNSSGNTNQAAIRDIEGGDNITAKDTSSASNILSTKAAKSKRSQTTPLVYFKSISEFPLNSGILSFSIVDAAVRRYKCGNDNYLCDELDDYDEELNSVYCVVLRMFIVQSKSMQECRILYQPTVTESTDVKSTISNESMPANESKDSSNLETALSNIGIINRSSNINNGDAEAEAVQAVDDDDDDDDDVEVDVIQTKHDATSALNIKQEILEKTEMNPLELLLSLNRISVGSGVGVARPETPTSIASVVAVAAAAAAAPSGANAELINSRANSPQLLTSAANTSGKNFGQVNLMTPDAFSATTNDKKTPECVNSDVLNTILMLASVASPASNPDSRNILEFVNNKIIEDQEHQKMQMKQSLESQKKFMSIDSSGRVVSDTNVTSGGSSPSREVQEILSLRDYKSSFSGDELLKVQSTKTVTDASSLAAPGAPGQIKAISVADLNLSVSTKANQSAAVAAASSLNIWPKPPMDVAKPSAELQNAANLISQAVNASAAANLNNSHMAPTLLSSGSSNTNHLANSGGAGGGSELSEINKKMNQLIDLVKVQSMQINSLQNEIADLKISTPHTTAKNMSELSFKLEMQLTKLMEQYLKRYETEHKKKLGSFLSGRDMQNRELHESVVTILNQYIQNQMGDVVSNALTLEIEHQLTPMLTTKIDRLQQQLQVDLTQNLNSFDMLIKDNIAQACQSKNIIDAFGKSVLLGVQDSLQQVFIESMSNTLIPAYEKSSQHMFQQLHDAFTVGIKEFLEQFDTYLQHLLPMQETTEEIINKFSGFRQHLDSILIKHRNTVTETMLETRKDVKGLEILLARQIQESVRTEVRKSFETQAVALRSQANTPAPIYDLKDTIKHLLHQGQINKAFHQALLANDLTLVEFTLKSADHNAVFTPDCCLEQKVLLSLIQQISADMSNHNEVKQNYLAEALLAINPLDAITREHAPKVLQELFTNCQMFLMHYPKSAQCSNVRMLMKAVQAYKDQF